MPRAGREEAGLAVRMSCLIREGNSGIGQTTPRLSANSVTVRVAFNEMKAS
jgi:hypothetical protein